MIGTPLNNVWPSVLDGAQILHRLWINFAFSSVLNHMTVSDLRSSILDGAQILYHWITDQFCIFFRQAWRWIICGSSVLDGAQTFKLKNYIINKRSEAVVLIANRLNAAARRRLATKLLVLQCLRIFCGVESRAVTHLFWNIGHNNFQIDGTKKHAIEYKIKNHFNFIYVINEKS